MRILLLLRRRRLLIANWCRSWRWDLRLGWLRWLVGFLDDGGEGGSVDKTHEEESLEDGVG